MARIYVETFQSGPGGWWAFVSNTQGPKPLEMVNGAIIARSPWWIDYNHAPPGAGYLHMLACLNTHGPQNETYKEAGGENRFISGSFPTDFTNARITLRLRGELADCGANLLLLIQAPVDGLVSGWMLTGQPLHVTPDWSEQTLELTPDPAQWTCLGSRHDRTDTYGHRPLEAVLSNVRTNIMLVLFPLDVVPMGQITGDLHRLRAERDYPVWRHRLPEGYVAVDEVRIAFTG